MFVDIHLYIIQALIKFKNHFYFEEKDEPVEEFEKVCSQNQDMLLLISILIFFANSH